MKWWVGPTLGRVMLAVALGGIGTAGAARPAFAPILGQAHPRGRDVALTFDDGPSAYTPEILSILRRFHVRATFFVVGSVAARAPRTLRREAADHEWIGDHTYNHADCQLLSNAEVLEQLRRTQAIIEAATHRHTHWFRPPYGAVDDRVSGLAARLHLRTVLWSVDPRDWQLPGSAVITSRVLAQVRTGSVILLHDGGGNRSETVAALPTILRDLLARGYHLEGLTQLFGSEAPSQVRGSASIEGLISDGSVIPGTSAK